MIWAGFACFFDAIFFAYTRFRWSLLFGRETFNKKAYMRSPGRACKLFIVELRKSAVPHFFF